MLLYNFGNKGAVLNLKKKKKKTIEIQLVRPTEVCGKVSSERKSFQRGLGILLLSNVIYADHQNSCLFTNKGHFSSL